MVNPPRNFFIIILLISLGGFQENISSQTYPFNHITTKDGLSNNSVYYIYQDHLGFMWFCTEDGLNRYDGYNFKIYRHEPGKLNSLSDYAVLSLYEDKDNILWIATREGLNRFDPSTEAFTHFKHSPAIQGSISDNKITRIYEDEKGNLWIGTRDGLNIFDREEKKFIVFKNNKDDPRSISDNFIMSFLEDKKGNLWIGTRGGLNKFNYEDSSFIFYKSDLLNQNSLSDNIINCLLEDSKGNIWVGTRRGFDKLEFNTDTYSPAFINHKKLLQKPHSEERLSIVTICETNDGLLWLGSMQKGILIFDTEKNELSELRQPGNIKNMMNSNISEVLKDHSGVIWISSNSKGVIKYSREQERFSHYNFRDFKDTESNYDISSVLNDSKGKLWIGTNGSGLFLINSFQPYQEKTEIIHFKADPDNPQSLNSNYIYSIIEDNEGIIWIGTFGGGLSRYNPVTNRFKTYRYKPGSININYIHSLYKDEKGKLWMGTGLNGLVEYDKLTETFYAYTHKPGDTAGISSNEVSVIFEDKGGVFWLGTTTAGLNRFDRKNKTFKNYRHNPDDIKSLSSQRIVTIFQDSNRKLWIGTFGGGLNLFDEKSETFIHFTVKDGLSGNTVNSIVEDKSGDLWLSTDKGISKFNPARKEFRNYDSNDGIQGTEFNARSNFYDKKKNLIGFGGTNGLNIFNPDEIRENKTLPKVVITDFQIFNHSSMVKNKSGEERVITFSDEAELSYQDNVFSFEFAAIHFSNPQKNQYAYKMEGFDYDWIYSGSRRFVTYTNLNSGEYIFKVKASNNDGIWNEQPVSIKVIINPPWWKTGWAYAIYVILIAGGLLTIRRIEKNRLKLRNEIKYHEFEAKKQREIEIMKARFFANLSHEFRTPLMLIKGPIERLLLDTSVDNPREQYEIIHRNSDKLQELIDQLLELSQLEAASIPLRAKEENIIDILKGLTFSFESLARQKNISLFFDSQLQTINAWVDRDKLEKIINNLLSNAFKFTSEGGSITVTVKPKSIAKEEAVQSMSDPDRNRDKNMMSPPLKERMMSHDKSDISNSMEICIKDTGVGIPQDKLEKIFDRFYQVDDSSKKKYSGSGIGLALVKELVELHKWRITVNSEENVGTEFILNIPYGDYLNENEKVKDISEPDYFFPESVTSLIEHTERLETSESRETNPSILIVEDSADVRTYISGLLKENYYLYEAKDGNEGIESAIKFSPDLIISDIMMPTMDGIEFCRRIKTNLETSHIPVILLTAKVAMESKIEGLETGADDYLTKPFNSKELFVRIKNLIEQRKKLKERFSKEINISTEVLTTSSIDNEFLQKAFNVIEKNMNNTDFDSEFFAKEMFVSRSQLHRKLSAITGQAPGEFIRSFKLKKAAQMILENRLSITQISFEIGFNSPSHFTKAFQQHFDCLPSEFKSKV